MNALIETPHEFTNCDNCGGLITNALEANTCDRCRSYCCSQCMCGSFCCECQDKIYAEQDELIEPEIE